MNRCTRAWIAAIGALAAVSGLAGAQIVVNGISATVTETSKISSSRMTERLRPAEPVGMPTLFLTGLDGRPHGLDEWRGRVVLVNFWASWCGPCQYEIPDLVELQNEYGTAGLQIVGVGVDDALPLRNVQRTLGINYPVLVVDPGRGGSLMRQWGNARQMVPYTVVVGRDGRIAYRHFGRLDREAFEDNVLPLIGRPD